MKYRKKPVVIEAWQYKGIATPGVCICLPGKGKPHLHTMHDGQIVELVIGDYIIPDGKPNTFYPCKPDIFEATYEKVEENG
jgi:hypothetical protein